jgi:hypothetical protein
LTARGHKPYRRCIHCRTSLPKTDLARVVRRPDWSVVVDSTGKASGRGAYLCRRQECIQAALKAGRLEKALRTRVPEEVARELLAVSVEKNAP